MKMVPRMPMVAVGAFISNLFWLRLPSAPVTARNPPLIRLNTALSLSGFASSYENRSILNCEPGFNVISLLSMNLMRA